MSGRVCHACGFEEEYVDGGLQPCERCHQVFYCSVECLQWDWKNSHADECEDLRPDESSTSHRSADDSGAVPQVIEQESSSDEDEDDDDFMTEHTEFSSPSRSDLISIDPSIDLRTVFGLGPDFVPPGKDAVNSTRAMWEQKMKANAESSVSGASISSSSQRPKPGKLSTGKLGRFLQNQSAPAPAPALRAAPPPRRIELEEEEVEEEIIEEEEVREEEEQGIEEEIIEDDDNVEMAPAHNSLQELSERFNDDVVEIYNDDVNTSDEMEVPPRAGQKRAAAAAARSTQLARRRMEQAGAQSESEDSEEGKDQYPVTDDLPRAAEEKNMAQSTSSMGSRSSNAAKSLQAFRNLYSKDGSKHEKNKGGFREVYENPDMALSSHHSVGKRNDDGTASDASSTVKSSIHKAMKDFEKLYGTEAAQKAFQELADGLGDEPAKQAAQGDGSSHNFDESGTSWAVSSQDEPPNDKVERYKQLPKEPQSSNEARAAYLPTALQTDDGSHGDESSNPLNSSLNGSVLTSMHSSATATSSILTSMHSTDTGSSAVNARITMSESSDVNFVLRRRGEKREDVRLEQNTGAKDKIEGETTEPSETSSPSRLVRYRNSLNTPTKETSERMEIVLNRGPSEDDTIQSSSQHSNNASSSGTPKYIQYRSSLKSSSSRSLEQNVQPFESAFSAEVPMKPDAAEKPPEKTPEDTHPLASSGSRLMAYRSALGSPNGTFLHAKESSSSDFPHSESVQGVAAVADSSPQPRYMKYRSSLSSPSQPSTRSSPSEGSANTSSPESDASALVTSSSYESGDSSVDANVLLRNSFSEFDSSRESLPERTLSTAAIDKDEDFAMGVEGAKKGVMSDSESDSTSSVGPSTAPPVPDWTEPRYMKYRSKLGSPAAVVAAPSAQMDADLEAAPLTEATAASSVASDTPPSSARSLKIRSNQGSPTADTGAPKEDSPGSQPNLGAAAGPAVDAQLSLDESAKGTNAEFEDKSLPRYMQYRNSLLSPAAAVAATAASRPSAVAVGTDDSASFGQVQAAMSDNSGASSSLGSSKPEETSPAVEKDGKFRVGAGAAVVAVAGGGVVATTIALSGNKEEADERQSASSSRYASYRNRLRTSSADAKSPWADDAAAAACKSAEVERKTVVADIEKFSSPEDRHEDPPGVRGSDLKSGAPRYMMYRSSLSKSTANSMNKDAEARSASKEAESGDYSSVRGATLAAGVGAGAATIEAGAILARDEEPYGRSPELSSSHASAPRYMKYRQRLQSPNASKNELEGLPEDNKSVSEGSLVSAESGDVAFEEKLNAYLDKSASSMRSSASEIGKPQPALSDSDDSSIGGAVGSFNPLAIDVGDIADDTEYMMDMSDVGDVKDASSIGLGLQDSTSNVSNGGSRHGEPAELANISNSSPDDYIDGGNHSSIGAAAVVGAGVVAAGTGVAVAAALSGSKGSDVASVPSTYTTASTGAPTMDEIRKSQMDRIASARQSVRARSSARAAPSSTARPKSIVDKKQSTTDGENEESPKTIEAVGAGAIGVGAGAAVAVATTSSKDKAPAASILTASSEPNQSTASQRTAVAQRERIARARRSASRSPSPPPLDRSKPTPSKNVKEAMKPDDTDEKSDSAAAVAIGAGVAAAGAGVAITSTASSSKGTTPSVLSASAPSSGTYESDLTQQVIVAQRSKIAQARRSVLQTTSGEDLAAVAASAPAISLGSKKDDKVDTKNNNSGKKMGSTVAATAGAGVGAAAAVAATSSNDETPVASKPSTAARPSQREQSTLATQAAAIQRERIARARRSMSRSRSPSLRDGDKSAPASSAAPKDENKESVKADADKKASSKAAVAVGAGTIAAGVGAGVAAATLSSKDKASAVSVAAMPASGTDESEVIQQAIAVQRARIARARRSMSRSPSPVREPGLKPPSSFAPKNDTDETTKSQEDRPTGSKAAGAVGAGVAAAGVGTGVVVALPSSKDTASGVPSAATPPLNASESELTQQAIVAQQNKIATARRSVSRSSSRESLEAGPSGTQAETRARQKASGIVVGAGTAAAGVGAAVAVTRSKDGASEPPAAVSPSRYEAHRQVIARRYSNDGKVSEAQTYEAHKREIARQYSNDKEPLGEIDNAPRTDQYKYPDDSINMSVLRGAPPPRAVEDTEVVSSMPKTLRPPQSDDDLASSNVVAMNSCKPKAKTYLGTGEDIESGEDEKGPSAGKRSRHRKMLVFGGLLLLIALGLGLGLGLRDSDSAPRVIPSTSNPPTRAPIDDGTPTLAPAPTSVPSFIPGSPTVAPAMSEEELSSILVPVSADGGEAIATDGSPQNQAFTWLLEDPVRLAAISEARIVQLYALASFFYSTGGPSLWRNKDGWLEGDDECAWYSRSTSRPVCDTEGFYINLDLAVNRMGGTIPREIGLLSLLTRVDLSGDGTARALSGPVPLEIGSLTKLTSFNLQLNELSGAIPSEIGQMTSLRVVDFRRNFLSGVLPSSIVSATSLRELRLADNDFNGPLPEQLGSLTQLEQLLLHNNRFEGPVPSSIGSLVLLEDLTLESNEFTSLPSSLGQLTNLDTLSAEDNSLEGQLFTEIGEMTALKRIYLANNSLSGPIPSEIGNLRSVQQIYLSSNSFNGPIPSTLGNLSSSLLQLELQANQLSGAMPASLGGLRRIQLLRFDDNNLTGTVPDEVCSVFSTRLPTFYVDCRDPAEIACPTGCCTYCCADGAGCECEWAGTSFEFLCV